MAKCLEASASVARERYEFDGTAIGVEFLKTEHAAGIAARRRRLRRTRTHPSGKAVAVADAVNVHDYGADRPN
jgi:hypothetical protein